TTPPTGAGRSGCASGDLPGRVVPPGPGHNPYHGSVPRRGPAPWEWSLLHPIGGMFRFTRGASVRSAPRRSRSRSGWLSIMPAPDLANAGRWMLNRRDFLRFGGTGLSGLALTALLAEQNLLRAAANPGAPEWSSARPHAPRPGHFRPRAKN